MVQAPDSCSRTVDSSSAVALPSICASTRRRYDSAALSGSMLSTDRPGAPGTATGVLRSSMPSISSRLDAASVLTSSTRLPASASVNAVALDSEVLPTPPLPVKKRYRVGWFRNPTPAGSNQVRTLSCDGMPPLWTTRSAMTTAGVACTP